MDYNVSDDFVGMVRSRVLLGEYQDNIPHGPFLPPTLNGASTHSTLDLPARLEKLRIRPTEDLGDRVYTGLAEIASRGVEVSVEDLS